MKKIILLTGAILMISTVANACGGTTIKSGKYCLSKYQMNWYSAYAWCQAQGMMMVDLNNDCGSSSNCSALKLSSNEKEQVLSNGGIVDQWAWTNTSSTSANFVYNINISNGLVNHASNSSGHYRPLNSTNLALCRQ